MWSKKLNETKNEISALKESIKHEQKAIKEMEKDISARRTKLVQLEEKLKRINDTL